MADVWLARFNRGLEKLFNVKGGPTVVDVNHQISSMIEVPTGVEERYLFGVESFAASDTQLGVAANKSAFMIRNPLGSGIIVVLEKILFNVGTANNGIIGAVAGSNPADLATTIATHPRADPRTRSTATAIVSRDAPAVDPGTGFLNIITFTAQTTPFDIILYPSQEILLLPQIAFRLINQNANTALACTFFWRERPLETSELT